MSFSQDVKSEIEKHLPQRRKDRIAFLAGMFMQQGSRNEAGELKPALYFCTEKSETARICFTLLKKTFNIVIDCSAKHTHNEAFKLKISGEDALKVSETLCMDGGYERLDLVDAESMKSFITGAFLCTGSLNDPNRSYHLEIVCSGEEKASFLASLLEHFDICPGVICRKRHFVLYIKDGSKIVDMLGIMDAHVSLMEMENSRILKDMRNSVNRRVNCETANIAKSVATAQKQIEDIKYLESTGRLKDLSPGLRQMAEVRLENPELPLMELGQLMDPPLGKSGVNHRLRKLSELASMS